MPNKIKEKLVNPLFMWIIVFIGIYLIFKFIPNNKLFDLGIYGIIIFLVTLIYWLYFFFNSINIHRKAALSVNKIEKIVKEGVYGIVRHPIYSSDIILGIGIFFLLPYFDTLLSIIWLAIVLFIWMTLEEFSLIKKFKDDYINYKKEVPMFIPRFWKKH